MKFFTTLLSILCLDLRNGAAIDDKFAATSKQIVLTSSVFEGTGRTILYVKSDRAVDNVGFRTAVSEVTGGATDFFNASLLNRATPPLETMLLYDCVMIHTGSPYVNPTEFGNALADYVDAGGTVVFSDRLMLALGSSGGRITQATHSPVGPAGELLGPSLFTPTYEGDGKSLLYSGISDFRAAMNGRDGNVPLQGNGIQDGTYQDGSLAGAHRPDFHVVYLNAAYCLGSSFPSMDCPGGDHILRWVNACSVSGMETTDSPTTTPSPTMSEGGATTPTISPTVTPAPTSCGLECLNGGICSVLSTGEKFCRCPAGTSGQLCELALCPDGNVCLNGGTCVRSGTQKDQYCCDCEASPKVVAGLFCDQIPTSFCNVSDPNSFCTNFGTCRDPPNLGCDCMEMYEGEHCEFVKGTTENLAGCLIDFSPAPSVSIAPSVSASPSIFPSVSPAPSISERPSLSPSLAPTNYPTITSPPSGSPTTSPAPSLLPSQFPSQQPSVSPAPSRAPSEYPSCQPSLSEAPSLQPSDHPSSVPSASPAPSIVPSDFPSNIPSSHQPSMIPSVAPTPTGTVPVPEPIIGGGSNANSICQSAFISGVVFLCGVLLCL